MWRSSPAAPFGLAFTAPQRVISPTDRVAACVVHAQHYAERLPLSHEIKLMRSCPKCSARITKGIRQVAQRAGGRSFLLTVPAGTCRICGAGYLDAEALHWGELQIACRLAMEGPVDGATLRAFRKVLGFLGSHLAEMLGVTAETISRWENGQRRMDRSAWIVVGSMVLEKADVPTCTLDRLKAVTRRPPSRAVTIDARPAARAERSRSDRISGVEERKPRTRRERP